VSAGVTAAIVVLAATIAASGALKLLAPPPAPTLATELAARGRAMALAVAALPFVELALAAGLVAPPTRRVAGLVCFVLLTTFSAVIVSNARSTDVVVDQRHQGRGTGRAIIARLEALAVAGRLGTRVDLVAAPDVVAFYRRLGYEPLHSELLRKPL
jgi:GNAT superfamily N-acetyltransferase